MTFQRGSPLSRAISMYGEASRAMIAARVMRIMCAITTRVRVMAGSRVTNTRSVSGMSAVTLEIEGNHGFCTEKNRMRM